MAFAVLASVPNPASMLESVRMDMKEISRVVYEHNWGAPDDWARQIRQLADLTDDQIVDLVGLALDSPLSVRG